MRDRLYFDEWAPTRFNLSIFRLFGFLVALSLKQRGPAPDMLLSQERYHHPLEGNVLTLGTWLIPTLHATMLVAHTWDISNFGTLIVFVIALLLTPPAWVILTVFLALPARLIAVIVRGSRYDGQTWAVQLTLIVIAVCSIVLAWPSAILGWIWLGCVALNVVASIICLAFRNNPLFLGKPAEDTA